MYDELFLNKYILSIYDVIAHLACYSPDYNHGKILKNTYNKNKNYRKELIIARNADAARKRAITEALRICAMCKQRNSTLNFLACTKK